jgi:di/tricarboxylate transporter
MPTPIASPQNAAALQAIQDEGGDVSFLNWMGFALPVCIPLILMTWVWMIIYWKPTLQELPKWKNEEYQPMTWKHYAVAFISSLTILLWATFQLTEDFFGSLGLVGLIPVIGL